MVYDHIRITNIITNPTLKIGSDFMSLKCGFESKVETTILREDWNYLNDNNLRNHIMWYNKEIHGKDLT